MGRYSKLDITSRLRSILAGSGRGSPPARTTRSVRRLRRLTGPEVDQLVEHYQSGESIRALAKDFSVHRTTISGQLKARGVLVPVRKVTSRESAEMVRRYERGWSIARTAEHFGVSQSVIARVLKEAGAPTRPVGTNQWSAGP